MKFFITLREDEADRYALPKKEAPEERPNPFVRDEYTYEPIKPNDPGQGGAISY